MPIGYMTQKIRDPQVDIFLCSEVQQYHGNLSSKLVLQDLLWFIALDKAGEEAEWLWHFLQGISRWPKHVPAICIHCDSQPAIGRAQSHNYNVTFNTYIEDTIR